MKRISKCENQNRGLQLYTFDKITLKSRLQKTYTNMVLLFNRELKRNKRL